MKKVPVLLFPIALAIIAVACKKSESPTDLATSPQIQTITIASGFSGLDTINLGGNVISGERVVGLYDLRQFDSVRIGFTAASVGHTQLSFTLLFAKILFADTLSVTRAYTKTWRSFEIVRADSVPVRFTNWNYNFEYLKLYNYSLVGWKK